VRRELDPLGADVGTTNPYAYYGTPTYTDLIGPQPLYGERGNPLDPAGGCSWNGMALPCDIVSHWGGATGPSLAALNDSARMEWSGGGLDGPLPIVDFDPEYLEWAWAKGRKVTWDDPHDLGWDYWSEMQNADQHDPANEKSGNPNCWKNILANGNQGVGQSFKLSADGTFVMHNGDHLLAPLGERGAVQALPAMRSVVNRGNFEGGLKFLDVKLTNGDIAILGDLTKINIASGRLRAGATIGYTRAGTAKLSDGVGLHVAIVKREHYQDFRRITRDNAAEINRTGALFVEGMRKITPDMFVRLDDDRSPLKCR
jgi:hypothetical protein